MAAVLKRPRAEQDLEEIWLHIALDDPEAATRFLERIEEKVNRLAQFPYMGRARPELAAHLRSFPVGNYVILYIPLAQGVEGIDLVRVVHSRRDTANYFQD